MAAFPNPTLNDRFTPEERRRLLTTPGLGPVVVAQLEGLGIGSLEALRRLGPDQVVDAVCRRLGTEAWRNRRRALHRALAEAAGAGTLRA